ncbi:hypothetical protein [Mycobacterium sp. C31M]
MDLMWAVVAVTVATFTVLVMVRRFLIVGSALVFSRYVRTVIRFLARRPSGPESLQQLPLYGRWRRTSSNSEADLLGPAATPLPTI